MKPIYPTRIWSWFAVAGVILALGACGQSVDPTVESLDAPTARPIATQTDDQQLEAITQGIDNAELLWERQAISSYRLTTSFVSLGSDITVTVVVRDGQVVEHECAPEPTESNIGCTWAGEAPERYTVAGLFVQLRLLCSYAQQESVSPNEAIEVDYDDQLGYPKRIVWNPPEYRGWNVTDFERLP